MHHPSQRLWTGGIPGDDDIIIATDGACSNNGYPNAVAGCGVYWGPYDYENRSFRLDDGVHPTSQRAELTAAIDALLGFKDVFLNGGFSRHIDYVIIKTDSAYMVNSMTNWIIEWRRNGYVDSSGRPIRNKDLIMELESLCREVDDLTGVLPCFWKVPRDDNTDADQLAKDAIR